MILAAAVLAATVVAAEGHVAFVPSLPAPAGVGVVELREGTKSTQRGARGL